MKQKNYERWSWNAGYVYPLRGKEAYFVFNLLQFLIAYGEKKGWVFTAQTPIFETCSGSEKSRQSPACIYISELMETSTALIVTSQEISYLHLFFPTEDPDQGVFPRLLFSLRKR